MDSQNYLGKDDCVVEIKELALNEAMIKHLSDIFICP